MSTPFLTATYDASTGSMSLYVNGSLVATEPHATSTAWNATGAFAVGRDLVDSADNAYFDGEVSNVETFNNSLTASQALNLYEQNN